MADCKRVDFIRAMGGSTIDCRPCQCLRMRFGVWSTVSEDQERRI